MDVALGTDALRLRAMRLVASTTHGRVPPGALLEVLAQLAASFDPALTLAAREALAARDGDYGSSLVLAMTARGRDAVVSAAQRAFAGGVDSADEALAVAQTVAQAGAHDEARALYEQLARWAPNRAARLGWPRAGDRRFWRGRDRGRRRSRRRCGVPASSTRARRATVRSSRCGPT